MSDSDSEDDDEEIIFDDDLNRKSPVSGNGGTSGNGNGKVNKRNGFAKINQNATA
jgi:hypothetical protein